jgi:predicted DCC family thiol-disulfide oxidoreductase YuxK
MAAGSGTMTYDGDCGFCTTAANWISRHWPAEDGVVAIPWQHLSPDFAKQTGLTEDDFKRSAWWIDGDRRYEGARAVAFALIAAGGPWSMIGRLLLTPPLSWVAPIGYRLVARYRYRLPGGTPACRV